ncbi:hypothetical protein [Actinomadura madurae]|uniref:hypothetical protein n=1 Tax=Actinomadura madurae TaxID=1993 RepID=UPI0020D25E25|nr:hypothetical protein [Actinomadura madurae]MCP9977844.1 hypothetical protein [Actinomadura madurae]MCQ0010655.1 hypothetical protein [Actinomadura madurae]MCQ0014027.1 hypothetical protein [Actinomadura madurae]
MLAGERRQAADRCGARTLRRAQQDQLDGLGQRGHDVRPAVAGVVDEQQPLGGGAHSGRGGRAEAGEADHAAPAAGAVLAAVPGHARDEGEAEGPGPGTAEADDRAGPQPAAGDHGPQRGQHGHRRVRTRPRVLQGRRQVPQGRLRHGRPSSRPTLNNFEQEFDPCQVAAGHGAESREVGSPMASGFPGFWA